MRKGFYNLEKVKIVDERRMDALLFFSGCLAMDIFVRYASHQFSLDHCIEIVILLLLICCTLIYLIIQVKRKNYLIKNGKLIMANLIHTKSTRAGYTLISAEANNNVDGNHYVFKQKEELYIYSVKGRQAFDREKEIGVLVDPNDWNNYYILVKETMRILNRSV